MYRSDNCEQSSCSNKVLQITTASQTIPESPVDHSNLNLLYIQKPIPPGVDFHIDKEQVIAFFKLNKTLIHKKLDPDSEEYDESFPEPIYISPRKPVWLLSELTAWQENLKAKREMNNKIRGNAHE